MPDLSTLVRDLKRNRDEILLKIHLGSRDMQDQWSQLETRWKKFEAEARLGQSAKDVGEAVQILGSELKDAYVRISKAL